MPTELTGITLVTKGEAAAADPGKVLYPADVGLQGALEAEAAQLHDVVGLDTPSREAAETAFIGMIRETGLDGYGIGRRLYELQAQADVLDARGQQLAPDDGGAAQPDDEAVIVQGWNEAARQELREMYGQQEAEALVARARKFAAGHPTLDALLKRHGIGSRPEVVRALVHHVRDKNLR